MRDLDAPRKRGLRQQAQRVASEHHFSSTQPPHSPSERMQPSESFSAVADGAAEEARLPATTCPWGTLWFQPSSGSAAMALATLRTSIRRTTYMDRRASYSQVGRVSDLVVQNFRCLRDVRLEGLSKFNFLIGENDVGKTTILESLYLLSRSSDTRILPVIQEQRGHNTASVKDLSYLFYKLDDTRPLRISTEGCNPHFRMELLIRSNHATLPVLRTLISQSVPSTDSSFSYTPRTSHKSGLTNAVFDDREIIEVRSMLSIDREDGDSQLYENRYTMRDDDDHRVNSIRSNQFNHQVLINSQMFNTEDRMDHAVVSEVIDANEGAELITALNKLNYKISKLAVRDGIVYCNLGEDQFIPLTLFGHSVVRATEIIASCIAHRPRVVLIDEIENGVHYTGIATLLITLMEYSRHNDVQFFFATHSLEVLQNALSVLLRQENELLRSQTVTYVLARDRKDDVRTYRYNYEQFEHCIGKGIEIR